jgi:F-type H+-transporting ATPase subunit delta
VSNLIVAKRYAKALLEIGRDEDKMEAYGEELGRMVEAFDQAPELEKVLTNPAFGLEDRSGVLNKILEQMSFAPMVNNFFRLLMDRGRIGATRQIKQVYDGLVDEARGVTRAQVFSAAPLQQDEIDQLKQALQTVAGGEVQIEVKEDPSLIGGVKARIGDLVLDGTVKTQLEAMKDSLRKGEYA